MKQKLNSVHIAVVLVVANKTRFYLQGEIMYGCPIQYGDETDRFVLCYEGCYNERMNGENRICSGTKYDPLRCHSVGCNATIHKKNLCYLCYKQIILET